MRLEEAPPPGWYPDPENSSRLRWWLGDDWSNRFRPVPTERSAWTKAVAAAEASAAAAAAAGWYPDPNGGGGRRFWDGSQWTDQVRSAAEHGRQTVDQMRQAAREEAQRTTQMLGAQARSMVREVGPLVEEYTNRAARFLRRVLVVAVVLGVAWFVFQAYANQSFFEWLGDRIDDATAAPAGALVPGSPAGATR